MGIGKHLRKRNIGKKKKGKENSAASRGERSDSAVEKRGTGSEMLAHVSSLLTSCTLFYNIT